MATSEAGCCQRTDNVASGAPVICLKGVHFQYQRDNPVVVDADFDIFAGEWICVVGPNGGGKSTLLKLILGLLQPDRGQIKVFGRAPERSRARLGYVPQHVHFDPLFPISALEVVLMGTLKATSLGRARATDKARAREALARMRLEDKAQVPFADLSGGQRQAVLIARALASEPDVLLLDEPTAHVDVAAEQRLLESLRSLRADLTVLTVSHDLAFVHRAVPKVICVNRNVHVHPTVELTEARLRELYGYDLKRVEHAREHAHSHTDHRHD